YHRLFVYNTCRKPGVLELNNQRCWCPRNSSICRFLLLFATQFLLLGEDALFPRFFNEFGCVNIDRFSKKVPECIRGVGDALWRFHYYAFVFRLYNEFVANFYAQFGSDTFG